VKLTLLFALVVERMSYYLVSRKVKDYSSYCLTLNASFVNLMAVAISYSWYVILHFNLFEWIPGIVFEFRHGSSIGRKNPNMVPLSTSSRKEALTW